MHQECRAPYISRTDSPRFGRYDTTFWATSPPVTQLIPTHPQMRVDLDLFVGYTFTAFVVVVMWCVPCDVRVQIGNFKRRVPRLRPSEAL